ncbi:MAG: FKBP-type peptidyl-prolyl cis-trans isomerase [Nitrospira defluvii]|nr:FKBP-type peptidyl-prolyl cis-trans isomerase [Nitrospira defluvii]
MMVSQGDVVSVEYTIRLADERVIETTVGDSPLIYTHGQNEILRGLEAGLDGMELGASKMVTVQPVDAYGEIHPEGFFEVQRDRVPAEAQRIGTKLEATAPDGRTVFPYVAEIKPDVIVLDLNHPLAGQTLRFDVRVVDIQRGDQQLVTGMPVGRQEER